MPLRVLSTEGRGNHHGPHYLTSLNPTPDHHPPLFAQQFACSTSKALICSFHARWLRTASNILLLYMKSTYNKIIVISEKKHMESKFQRCFTCIFAKVWKPCLQWHPAVRLSGPNLTTSTACWTTWPVMREQRPGSNAWCVGVVLFSLAITLILILSKNILWVVLTLFWGRIKNYTALVAGSPWPEFTDMTAKNSHGRMLITIKFKRKSLNIFPGKLECVGIAAAVADTATEMATESD